MNSISIDDELAQIESKIQAISQSVEPTVETTQRVEDSEAWQQHGQVEQDADFARQVQLRATGMIPTKTQEMMTQTPGGLGIRTFSSEKYDKMLAVPNLAPRTRRQIEQMRDKRIAKEGMDITLQTKLLNRFEVDKNDGEIAQALAAAEGTSLGAASAEIASLREELGISAEAAEAAFAGINQMWQTEDDLTRQEDAQRMEAFHIDCALAEAEQRVADAAMASKIPPEGKGKGVGRTAADAPSGAAVAMAMPIGGGGTGIADLDGLIGQLAATALIDETGLRVFIESQRRASLIRQLAENTGVSEEAITAFVEQNGSV